ncbi:uncharacterized protein BCR38DRAFT_415228 [Pseudomassariella vexata]|uniref:Heterokaryon incompatibility domain-containing protein n=1 Tax=Pseudomassariella vexata TaxID=1141098 RepID=A0A1Y2D7W9_9PEZI|nr:uncharacterized protein BCR38DRAFT_415228 [Pseudomassariella vexata]ORY54735.1 hypothetical protein BCR38DRAFT_415228 [Pseudomassariella vexata]
MNSADFNTIFESPLSSEACIICANLRRIFIDRKFYVNQGSFNKVLETPCLGHDSLLRLIRNDFDKRNPNHFAKGDNKTNNEDAEGAHGENDEKAEKGGEDGKNPSNHSADGFYGLTLLEPLLARHRNKPKTPGYGRVLDPDWVDLELAKRWKRDCFIQHGEKCFNPLRIRSVSPAWLIDVVENCLVPGAEIPKYVALSYRWGVVAVFRTNRYLLKTLQEPGALSQSRLGAYMAILRHTIGLTQAIDERYLWVDAICIAQDDEAHCAKEGAIYASAKLTIVVSDGDAMDGILGLKGISPPREFNQNVTPVFQNEKRGWTYQEFYLSKRRLTFANSQLRWHCTCADWHEDLIQSEDTPTDQEFLDRNLSSVLTGQPDFSALNIILSEYNQRELSFPEDALPGISGLLAILSRSYEGGFLFALPETCFDSALMWHTPFYGSMEERKDSGRTNLLALTSRIPSWSWISWKCFGLHVLDEESFQSSLKDPRTSPITQCPSQTPCISCVIKRGWFSAAQFPSSYFSDHERGWNAHIFIVGLLDGNGKYCGQLYLQRADDISHFPDADSGRILEVELVAICPRRDMASKARWRPKVVEEGDVEKPTYAEVYGVLWVEWNNVAYRKALGVVGKDAWEGHSLEDAQLVMG